LHLERGMCLRTVHARAGHVRPDPLDRRSVHPGLRYHGLSDRVNLRDLRIRREILRHHLRDNQRLPNRLRLCHGGRRVSAGLPARLVLRQRAYLQCQNRSLRSPPSNASPHRRAMHLERGMCLRLVHARARHLWSNLLVRWCLHAGLHRGLPDRIDLRELRIDRIILCRLVCSIERLPGQLRLQYRCPGLLARLSSGVVVWNGRHLRWADWHVRSTNHHFPRRRHGCKVVV
jgi:hypothetical protein